MKKIVAMMLALTLVLVSVSAMAAYESAASSNFTPQTALNSQQELTIKKGYSINDSKDADATDPHPGDILELNIKATGKYYFNGVEDTSVTVPMPTFPDAVQPITVTEGADKYDFKVKLPDFTGCKVGEYVYYLYETDSKTAGVTYLYTDEEPLILKVTLINETDTTTGELTGNVIIGAIALRHKSGENAGSKQPQPGKLNAGTGTKDDVHNDYGKGKLTVTKEVTGNMGDTTKEWIFKVDFETTNSEIVRGTINMSGTNKGKYYGEPTVSGESATAPVTADEQGHITGTAITGDAANAIAPGTNGWSKKTVYITLKHGQDFVFDNIPEGVTYTVTEIEANKYGYNTTPETAPNGEMTAGGEKTADFVNDKSQTPDTGIGLDTVPYMMIMAIALMGVAMMIVRRREEM